MTARLPLTSPTPATPTPASPVPAPREVLADTKGAGAA